MRNEVTIHESFKSTVSLDAEDYGGILDGYGLEYRKVSHYYRVGEITWTEGWIIDISVIISQFKEMLDIIIPLLVREKIAFKIPLNPVVAKSILIGHSGYHLLGKVICIYPEYIMTALPLVHQLIDITQQFKGPKILTDCHLGGTVYTRFGSCNPVIHISEQGNAEEYIYDAKGNLIKDGYLIPFQLPEDRDWPFGPVCYDKTKKDEKFLHNRYMVTSELKEDAKGNVMKALYLKRWFRIKWCIVKEGKQNMVSDFHGRSIADRLSWQYELHQKLRSFIPIPKVYELFEHDGSTYLAMEYIHGKLLDAAILDIFQANTWNELTQKDKLRLLGFAEQILDITQRMHCRGYIHRDINPVNFLVTKKGQIIPIDVELTYSLESKTPPYEAGTAWFMSPEQEQLYAPTAADDVYSLGATMLVLLTGLLPHKFDTQDTGNVTKQLNFFIKDSEFAHAISQCFSQIPDLRPSVSELQRATTSFRIRMCQQSGSSEGPNTNSDLGTLTKQTIRFGLNGLLREAFFNQEYLWLSKTIQHVDHYYYQVDSKSSYGGLYVGIGGVLFLLACAHRQGYSIENCGDAYMRGWDLIRGKYLLQIEEIPGGLYAGSAGIALALAAGLQSALIKPSERRINELKLYLGNCNINGLDIATGLSGQIIALLHARPFLDDGFAHALLNMKVELLLRSQEADGSWYTPLPGGGISKITGFGHGVAGICYALLGYLQATNNHYVKPAILKGLKWLQKASRTNKGKLIWPTNSKSRDVEPGFDRGCAGIVLCFIKGFEVLQSADYRSTAEEALLAFPHPFNHRCLNQADGLSGIGEIYLEAYRVLGGKEWKDRSNWIQMYLLHQKRSCGNEACTWMVDDTSESTADFMTGNSGVIHYLIRCIHPEIAGYSFSSI